MLTFRGFWVIVRIAKLSGARYIVTDAYVGKTSFYEKYGFRPILGGSNPNTVKMFLDLNVIRIANNQRREEKIAN